MVYAFLSLLILGIILLIIGLIGLFTGTSKKGYTQISGKVEGIEKTINTKKGSSSIYLYSPIVTYKINGESYATPPHFTPGESNLRIGDEIDVYYNPENHEDSFSPLLTPPKKLTVLYFGLLFLVAAGVIYGIFPNLLLTFIK